MLTFVNSVETAPADLTVYCHLLNRAQTKKTLAVMFAYIGKKEDGERITKPLVEHGKPYLTNIKYVSYEELQKSGGRNVKINMLILQMISLLLLENTL